MAKRGWIALLLAALLMLTCVSVLADAEEVSIPNPIHEVDSYEALCAALPDIAIDKVPEDAAEVTYDWIEGDPKIAEIQFSWGDHDYTYRAAACADDVPTQEIDGVYADFTHVEEIPGLFDNGQVLTYSANEDGNGMGLVTWNIPSVKTQYSLFSETAGMPDATILRLAKLIVPTDSDDAAKWAANDDE